MNVPPASSHWLIVGGPAWMDADHFDVEAKVDGEGIST